MSADGGSACLHEDFHARVEVNRLVEGEELGNRNAPAVGYCAEIRIHCSQCGRQFQFLGVGLVGILPDRPTVDPDFATLRAPIAPAGERLQGTWPGFLMRPPE